MSWTAAAVRLLSTGKTARPKSLKTETANAEAFAVLRTWKDRKYD